VSWDNVEKQNLCSLVVVVEQFLRSGRERAVPSSLPIAQICKHIYWDCQVKKDENLFALSLYQYLFWLTESRGIRRYLISHGFYVSYNNYYHSCVLGNEGIPFNFVLTPFLSLLLQLCDGWFPWLFSSNEVVHLYL